MEHKKGHSIVGQWFKFFDQNIVAIKDRSNGAVLIENIKTNQVSKPNEILNTFNFLIQTMVFYFGLQHYFLCIKITSFVF